MTTKLKTTIREELNSVVEKDTRKDILNSMQANVDAFKDIVDGGMKAERKALSLFGSKQIIREKIKEQVVFDSWTKEQVKKVCYKYLLRYVRIRDFKGEIPAEALKRMDTFNTFQGEFMIICPKELLHTVEANVDPVLVFRYYGSDKNKYVYSWGADLSKFRQVKAFYEVNKLELWSALLAVPFFMFLHHVIPMVKISWWWLHMVGDGVLWFVSWFIGALILMITEAIRVQIYSKKEWFSLYSELWKTNIN